MTPASEPRQEHFGLRAWAGIFHAMPQAHRHNELELNYVLSGTVTYLIGGSLVTLPPRRLCALWGAVPHQTLADGAARVEALWVTVPLARVLAWDLPRPLVERLLRHGCAIEDGAFPGDAALLGQWAVDLREPSSPDPRAVLLELEARLCRMAGRLEPSHPADKTAPAAAAFGEIPVPVVRLMRFLADRYREPVTVEDAARAAHVHAHYAMMLFRRHTGLTLHQYLTLQRVAHAQRLLATTRQPIVDVALDSGFASLSRFYAAFKAQTGGSPRRFRAQVARAVRSK